MRKQMNKERTEAYVEVLEILEHMDNKYVEKIPFELIDFFNKNASKEYKFKLNETIPFEEQVLKETTINILAMLNLNYWCEDEEHKKELLEKYYNNELIYQQELNKKYSTENLFKKQKKIISVNVQEDTNNFPEYYEEEEKWYIKLYENISRYIRRIFNGY